ncbi:MAG: hypothetical protein K8R92_06305 [Planctomycetes bacterium]|nr:hypothetical protein [Planctomycetota bacterium]
MSNGKNWLASMAMVLCCARGAGADVVSAWDFNALTGTVPATLVADTGHGGLSLAEFTGGLSVLSGTDINAVSGVAAGQGLTVTGSSQNSKSMVIDVDTQGMQQLQLSVAARRSTSGFAGMLVQIWNGQSWLDVGTISASTTQWVRHAMDLSAFTFADNGSLRLRIQLSGATGASGNARLDNLRVDGTIVPAPGVLAAAGAAAAGARRGARTLDKEEVGKDGDKQAANDPSSEPAKSRGRKPGKKPAKDPR